MEDLNQLLHKACKGDKDAFGQIYKIYFRKIYRYCRINLNNEAQAEDVAQETFLKAWRSLSSFSTYDGSSIQAFLFRIARNALIDLSRKKQEYPLEEALDIESGDDIERELDKKEEIEKVQQALKKLEERERQIVILRFFEEMTGAEIARVMEINEGAVRVRLHRILKKLKEVIGG